MRTAKYFVFWPFTISPYCANISFSFWKVSNKVCLVLVVSRMSSAYAIHCFRRVVIFPLSSICFIIVSITKLNKVADKGSPCLTSHFTIHSSVKSLFTLTLAVVCIKFKAIN